jgi:hypothetical protein
MTGTCVCCGFVGQDKGELVKCMICCGFVGQDKGELVKCMIVSLVSQRHVARYFLPAAFYSTGGALQGLKDIFMKSSGHKHTTLIIKDYPRPSIITPKV